MEKEKMKMGLGNISRPSSLVMVVSFSVVVTSCCSIIAAEDGTCEASGNLVGTNPGQCNQENNSECCKDGVSYPLFNCSPPVTEQTAAKLTLNSFEKGGDGGAPSECDNMYHKNDELVVALSTGWFWLDNNKRCQKSIMIFGNGNHVNATVVDECDSTTGCDEDHDFQPPCGNNVVDASKAVWDALGVPEGDRGELDIEWSDA